MKSGASIFGIARARPKGWHRFECNFKWARSTMWQLIRKLGWRPRVSGQAPAKLLTQLTNKFSRLSVTAGPNNALRLEGMSEGRGSIGITGSGNTVEFLEGVVFNGSIDIRGNNNRILIGPHCVIRGRILVKGNKQTVSVGERTTFQSVYLLCQEACDVTIGRWCMFSRDIEIRTTDAHSVVDASSGRRLNQPDSVVIGDHVWISVGAMISKGAQLAEDSVVGAHSFVNGRFIESGTLIAGAPAKIVKRGITWNRSRKPVFTNGELNAWRLPATVGDDDLSGDDE